jgi:hypothetical protein
MNERSVMKRAVLIGLVAFCALLRPAHAYAQADFFDWLEQLSGPGPFHGYFRSVNSRVLCTHEEVGAQRVDWWCGNDTDRNIRHVVSAEVAWPDSDSNRRFDDATSEPQNNGTVRATRVMITYQYRFHPMVDMGLGIGSLVFSGSDFTNQVHPVISPLTLTFTPFAFMHGETSAKWGRLIRVEYAERLILGDIRAQDFNSLKSTYFKQGEWNSGISLSVDFWPFIDRRR